MNLGFSCYAEHTPQKPIGPEFGRNLPPMIMRHTGHEYICTELLEGFELKPTFRHGTTHNSFLPCMQIIRSGERDNYKLKISGRPVEFVRVFMIIWFAFLAQIAAFLALIFMINKEFDLFPIIVITAMLIFGYCLCKFATKAGFIAVLSAIKHAAP